MWALATIEREEVPQPCVVRGETAWRLADLASGAGLALPATLSEIFAQWEALGPAVTALAEGAESAGLPGFPTAGARFAAPLAAPGKILCAGANYYDHMAEMGFPGVTKESQRLFFFFKPPRQAVRGPGAVIPMPRGTQKYDWEIELAAVIGRSARYVSVEDALSHVAGYTIALDLSARDFNMAPEQFYKLDWVAGKATDGSCPMGPVVVPAAAIPDPQAVPLKLSLNGETRQDSTSAQMIFSVAEQIARASEIMTLEPGDVILTGTPAGVGVPSGTFLKPGDTIRAEIPGIGALEVSIAAPV
ncbi:fumarylacetoacetate hydrolase family protein (plasmid) [Paroceanicella profunda]|uniref:Fumarylacetoacetate hydrolase family protein n=1 Tax=Paroceanicella profunda TaxID=2579971 RepID=A0A5B8FJA3_9RHOB|nr:fumarylacetoacetate hydrolase family protein [Paroceanicella profunda]QDL94018.1 fumarylacetoacetate hydrolase family protein [Paroceanicella profunda]